MKQANKSQPEYQTKRQTRTKLKDSQILKIDMFLFFTWTNLISNLAKNSSLTH